MLADPIEHLSVPLATRPKMLRMAVAVHGYAPREDFREGTLTFWSLHFYQYRARLRIRGNWYDVRPGCVSLCPPLAWQTFEFSGLSEHTYAHFHWNAPPGSGGPTIPAFQDLGERFERLESAFREAVGWSIQQQTDRADVRLWDVLWQLSDAVTTETGRGTSCVLIQNALRYIENSLAEPLTPRSIVSNTGVSHNHFLRLMRAETGMSIVQYVRHRRMQRALHLLRYSDLPIKQVGAAVGIPDPHFFNKLVRRAFGRAPREIRRGHQGDQGASGE